MSAPTIRPLTPADAVHVRSMTFPAYRHMLALAPVPRHPEQGDRRQVQPIGVAAWDEQGTPLGAVVAELPLDNRSDPELLSVFVAAPSRRQGLGEALVAALEQEVRARGFARLGAVYSTGKPEIAAIERIFARRGWDAPVARSVTVRFSPAQALATPWFGRLTFPGDEYEIFSWTDLRADERQALMAEQREQGWIPTGLEPWRHDVNGFDRVSSVGLRHRGRVAGWVINHQVSPDTVRFTCSWMRDDMRGLARILPLYTESLRRLLADGRCQTCMFITPVGYPGMVEFVRKRCAKWGSFFGETKGAVKSLAAEPIAARSDARLE